MVSILSEEQELDVLEYKVARKILELRKTK
jgi:hypothetical protein